MLVSTMTTPATIVTLDAAMRERYTDEQVLENLLVEDNPFLAMVPKDPDYEGESEPVPSLNTGAQGTGSKLSTARANAAASESHKFDVTVGDYYGVAEIQDKAMMLTKSKIGALVKIKGVEIDTLYTTHFNDISLHCWSNGGGALGVQGSETSAVMTLATLDDIVNFEINQVIVISNDDGSLAAHALRDSGATMTVTEVNYALGTFTTAAIITGQIDGDFFFRQSEFGGDEGARMIKGVPAWVPAADPTSATFFGLDRTKSPTRMAGVRIRTSRAVGNIEERVKALLRGVHTLGKGNPKHVWMHDENWGALETSLEAKGYRNMVTEEYGNFGFEGLTIRTPNGKVMVYADRRCPQNRAFALTMPKWRLASAGPLAGTLNGDGLEMLRKSSGDDASYEYVLKAYPQLICQNLAHQGTIALPTVAN